MISGDVVPPTISNVHLSNNPLYLSETLYVSADVTDNVGVASVQALASGSTEMSKTMIPTGEGNGYACDMRLSLRDPRTPETYDVRIIAKDAAGNTSASETIRVAVKPDPVPF